MSLRHNAPQVAQRLRSAAAGIALALNLELRSLAAEVASRMRVNAPKFRSTLANSIREDLEAPLRWFVGPHVDYALWVEKGRQPGKGLPRFFDPAAASLQAWLLANPLNTSAAGPRAAPGRLGRVGSARRQSQELELRDRYMALSNHALRRGLKAHPYVKPTADEFRAAVPSRLAAAVQRGLSAFRAQQGTA